MEIQWVREEHFQLSSPSNERFYVSRWLPGKEMPRAIVLVIPGMAEHAGRYAHFARFMARNGYGIYSCDHPGQGLTAGRPERAGITPRRRGWEIMLENVRALYSHIRKTQPVIPVFLLGHSMGSVLARHFTALYPVYTQGLVLSGSSLLPPGLLTLALGLVRLKILFQGHNKKSRWFNRLFYWSLNRHFHPRPTRFEWISSVREEVDRYQEDPHCGIFYTNAFYLHLFKGIAATRRAEHLITYRKTLPVLVLSGQDDPVGRFGKDAVRIHQAYYEEKFQHLSLKIFPGRHELLHEENREAVYDYLLDWFEASLKVK